MAEEESSQIQRNQIRGRRSEVWDHFTRLSTHDDDGKTEVKCNNCNLAVVLARHGTGTSSMRRHIRNCSISSLRDHYDQTTLLLGYEMPASSSSFLSDLPPTPQQQPSLVQPPLPVGEPSRPHGSSCLEKESADAGTSEQLLLPQPVPSLAQDDEAIQQLPSLPPVPLPSTTHRGSVDKDGGAVQQLDAAETSRRGRAKAPRRRQPPHGQGKRWRQSASAIALFLSKKGKHVRREAAGLTRAPRVSDACNRLGSDVFTLDELRQITNIFSDDQLIGEGAFGKVYKGLLTNGNTIAVKRFASTIIGLQDVQYENEAQHLMRLKHPNIVQLLGCCSEKEVKLVRHNGTFVRAEQRERLLCLEYMPKGSLCGHLSDETCGLEWNTRYKIIEGICYGLHYLHEEWEATPIIHMDLKPANILLDDNMVPKIADFGLSRLFGEEKTRTCTTSRKGTLGYMAPEYLEKGLITKKFDIFSLGVIIIEIITGLKDYPTDETETTSQQYIDLVLNKWKHRLKKAQRYTSQDIDYQQIKKCIQIGLLCVKFDRVKRPTINQIIKMLEGPDEAYQSERESALEGAGYSSNDIIAKKMNIDSTRPLKKSRTGIPSPLPTFKVRKEKPGDRIAALKQPEPTIGKSIQVRKEKPGHRIAELKQLVPTIRKLGDTITALQQLVSPSGKTDTASVLEETIEYIKFLHSQVGALSSAPYCYYPKNRQQQQVPHHKVLRDGGQAVAANGELTRGYRALCLVPVSSTLALWCELLG